MNQSESINELSTALSKAQGQMNHAVKDTTNAFFKSSYADLASVWDAARAPLVTNGLAVIQTLEIVNDKQALTTMLTHSSGQWIKSTMFLPVVKPGSQEVGSCITYCRRYSLAAICGVAQSDDDAESAMTSIREDNKNSSRSFLSKEQKTKLDEYIQKFPTSNDALCRKYQLKNIHDLPVTYYDYVCAEFEKKLKEIEERKSRKENAS
jgi:hypothetical protein